MTTAVAKNGRGKTAELDAAKPTTTPAPTLTITPLNMRVVQMRIIGDSPLVINRMSEKAMKTMEEKQRAGGTAKTRKARAPRDFEADFRNASYVSEEGWYGLHASSFRNAAIDVCRVAGLVMTRAKLAIFVIADGLDKKDGTPLVRIHGDEPENFMAYVRNATGVVDLRARPMWRKWSCVVTVRYDADVLTEVDVVNLMMRVGAEAGLGEGRPNSKNSNGLGFGTFHIQGEDEK